MAVKIEDLKAQLDELETERTELDAEIEAMIEDMAAAAPESRAASAWGPTGASTLKYLELTNQQAEIEAHVIELRRAIAAEEGKAAPLQ